MSAMAIAQASSHITNRAASALRRGRCCKQGVSAALMRMWRLFTSRVTAAITSALGGKVHTSTAANSEPPAKLRPAIRPISKRLSPFCAACAPSASASGIMASTTGRPERTPRQSSERAGALASCAASVFTLLIHPSQPHPAALHLQTRLPCPFQVGDVKPAAPFVVQVFAHELPVAMVGLGLGAKQARAVEQRGLEAVLDLPLRHQA